MAVVIAAACAHAQPKAVHEDNAPERIRTEMDEMDGAVVYTRKGRVRKVVIGKEQAVDLGPGTFARWSPDGKRIAVYHEGQVFVMNADGTERKVLVRTANKGDGSSIEFHTNNREIIYWLKDKGFFSVNIETGKVRSLGLPGKYSGEPGISADGTRMAAREGRSLWAIDVAKKQHRLYNAQSCSPGVSPDGSRLMNNTGAHRELVISNWDGSGKTRLTAKGMKPDQAWDNHHWSNHDDYIAAQGEGGSREAYVIKISENRTTRVTWEGDVTYPDLFVASIRERRTPASQPVRHQKQPGSPKPPSKEQVVMQRLTVECRLLARTATPDPKRLEDYTRAMAAYAYEVVKDTEPLRAGAKIIVCHWVIIDRQPVSLPMDTIGNIYRLTIESFGAHPALESERLLIDLDDFDLPMFIYIDTIGKRTKRKSGEPRGRGDRL